jgi:hypothetical protein
VIWRAAVVPTGTVPKSTLPHEPLAQAEQALPQAPQFLPIIQAGGCGGYFKTGWTVNVDTTNTGSPTLTQGQSESQCGPGSDGMVDGIHQGTGTDPSVANAPINKYYYNLMNALGVKGDADGFPAQGGVAEVSQFGYSDLTTDFNGGLGAVAGAGIHNPGEYAALKAGS